MLQTMGMRPSSPDMPGVRREDLKIRIDNNVLTLSGNRPKQTLPEGGSWIRNETWDGAFSRSIQLPAAGPKRIPSRPN